MGWPTGRESYGHGVLVVVVGVTPHQGERESRSQGEAGQVVRLSVATLNRAAWWTGQLALWPLSLWQQDKPGWAGPRRGRELP